MTSSQTGGGGIAARARADLAAPRDVADAVRDHAELLLRRHGGGFAGRAADDDRVHAAGELEVQQLFEFWIIDGTALEGRDQRGRNAFKNRLLHPKTPLHFILL